MSNGYMTPGSAANSLGSIEESGKAQDYAAANMVGWIAFAISLLSPLPCWMFMCAFKKYKNSPNFGKPVRGIFILGFVWVAVVLITIISMIIALATAANVADQLAS